VVPPVRVAAVTRPCPRLDKVAYISEAQACGYLADLLASKPDVFNVYECRCGAWHGGRFAADVSLYLPADEPVRTFGPPLELDVAHRVPDEVRRMLEA
jgi:hypothetical protein